MLNQAMLSQANQGQTILRVAPTCIHTHTNTNSITHKYTNTNPIARKNFLANFLAKDGVRVRTSGRRICSARYRHIRSSKHCRAKTSEDKILILDSQKLLAATGENGDRVQFSEFIQKNIALYKFRTGTPLSTSAAANYTRGELALALRKNPYSVNMMIAGFDKDEGASLYYLDYIATLHKVDKGAMGYGGFFILSLMDKYYEKNMNLEAALELADRCIAEIKKRLIAAPPNFIIKIVDKDGARELSWRKTVEDTAGQ